MPVASNFEHTRLDENDTACLQEDVTDSTDVIGNEPFDCLIDGQWPLLYAWAIYNYCSISITFKIVLLNKKNIVWILLS